MWYVGVALAMLASLSGTAGKQLLRYSELQRQKSAAEVKGSKAAAAHDRLRRLSRFVGLGLNTVVGPLVDMASYGFAAQSLIAPFGGLDIVWNTLLAPFTLHEKLTRSRIVGAALIATGTTVSVVFGVHEEKEFSRDVIQELILSFRTLIYLCILAGFVGGNILFFSRLLPGVRSRGLSLGITAGTIAGNMFCVKATAELIKASFREGGAETWLHWFPWLCLLGAVSFALGNLRFMERGMREYEALFMATLYEGSMIVTGGVSGAVVLREFDSAPISQICGYGVCVLVITTGIATLYIGEEVLPRLSEKNTVQSIVPEMDRTETQDLQRDASDLT